MSKEVKNITKIQTHQEKEQRYAREYSRARERDGENLSETTRDRLSELQQTLGLEDGEIASIEVEISASFRDYQEKLQQYEQALVEATNKEFPLTKETSDRLQRFQKFLKLSDKDIIPLEARIIAQKQQRYLVEIDTDNKESFNVARSQVERDLGPEDSFEMETNSVTTRETLSKPKGQVAFLSAWFGAAVVALGLLAGVSWWLIDKTNSQNNLSSIPLSEENGNIKTSVPSYTGQYGKDFLSVNNVPSGEFAYGGSVAWMEMYKVIDPAIEAARPEFKLRYTLPENGIPSSSAGLRMLLDDRIAFAHSSRPLHADEYQKALKLGYTLSEITVALEPIAIVVNPNLNISGLTLSQLKDIYTGKITNWNQVGGPNLKIIPYSFNAKDSGIAEFFERDVMESLPFANNVVFVQTTTNALREVAANPGAIYYASAPEVVGQCSIKLVAIGNNSDRLISPYSEPLVPASQCPERRNKINMAAMETGQYPILQPLFVAVKYDGKVNQQAGEAYANFMLSDRGQKIIRQAGFIPIRCLSKFIDKLDACH